MNSRAKWPRVYKDQLVEPTVDEPPLDFDETISAELESTRRDMRVLTEHNGREVEMRNEQNRMNEALTNEVAELRHVLAKTVQTLNTKCSRNTLRQALDDLEKKRRERWDTTRNWLIVLCSVLGLLFAVWKGRG